MTSAPFNRCRVDDVLRTLRDSDAPLTTREVAQLAGIAEVSARRHLRTLRLACLAERVPRVRLPVDGVRGRVPDRYRAFGPGPDSWFMNPDA